MPTRQSRAAPEARLCINAQRPAWERINTRAGLTSAIAGAMGQCTSDSIAMTQYLKRSEPDNNHKAAARESLLEPRGALTSTNRLSDRPTYTAKNASIERRLRGRARIIADKTGKVKPKRRNALYSTPLHFGSVIAPPLRKTVRTKTNGEPIRTRAKGTRPTRLAKFPPTAFAFWRPAVGAETVKPGE